KALIAAAEAAHGIRTSSRFGFNGHEPEIDFAGINDHVRDVIASVAPHDSIERFTGLGVEVINGSARFIGPDAVAVGSRTVKARRFVIATGSRAFVPPIPGIDSVPVLTNETVFDLRERPEHLIVIGAGPIGVELAQAHRRLGSRVTIIEMASMMPKDDPEAVDVVRRQIQTEGILLLEHAKVGSVARIGNSITVMFHQDGVEQRAVGTHLLVAAGRRPNVENLGLPAAGIDHDNRGVKVDARLRTTNKRVFAVGDVAGGLQFTHVAGYHAGIVIRNALFNLPAKAEYRAVPWVTFTDPELAHVGLAEERARAEDASVTSLKWPFSENDRAQAERATEGFIKVIVGKKGTILGATIVGRHAGELILPWVVAVQKQLKIRDMATVIAPYPTLSEVSKRAAGAWYAPKLFSERTRRLVRMMQMLP
ncbi:MAG TPA: FAD-dependent oxidoreductase, partial [Hyphomicrobiaceae bacterium]|nr:FAD-dependent oxidoreductase [Hyphomicrobiaceae bacterium]